MSTDLPEINCITLGTPPISSIPLHSNEEISARSGLFLSFVNEGDPVLQAQEDFIKTLIDVYLLNPKKLCERYPAGVQVPRGHFRPSGKTVIFRDVEPNDEDGNDIRPYITDTCLLEKKLFGNPFVHSIREYSERIEQTVVS